MIIDQLVAEGRFKSGFSREQGELIEGKIESDMPGYVRVDGNNVNAHYDHSSIASIYDDFMASDGLIAPWDHTWIEFKPIAHRDERERQWAAHVAAAVDIFPVEKWRNDALVTFTNERVPNFIDTQDIDGAEYVVAISPFIKNDGDPFAIGPIGVIVFGVTKDGRVAKPLHDTGVSFTDGSSLPVYCYSPRSELKFEEQSLGRFQAQLALLVGCVFTFANCKNVIAEEIPMQRQQRRALQRKGIDLPNHYALRVASLAEIRKGPVREKTAPVGENRFHIVRGHFSHYGDAYGRGKLFGKYEGRFWVPATAKGRRTKGEIDKSYELVAPGASDAA